MDHSIFTDKTHVPDQLDLQKVLQTTFEYWQQIENYLLSKQSNLTSGWNYSGAKYGWSHRISDKKRAIIYFLPRDSYFKVAMVFGEKAYQAILKSNVSDQIKKELSETKVYAEGRSIRIDINDCSEINEIFTLIDIKRMY